MTGRSAKRTKRTGGDLSIAGAVAAPFFLSSVLVFAVVGGAIDCEPCATTVEAVIDARSNPSKNAGKARLLMIAVRTGRENQPIVRQ